MHSQETLVIRHFSISNFVHLSAWQQNKINPVQLKSLILPGETAGMQTIEF
jgi:hypothetical protein